MRNLRSVRSAVTLLFAMILTQAAALAQECPGTQRLVVGLATGGGMDALARQLAQRVGVRFGRTIVVENRSGASGNIAAEFVARAHHDGCTLIIRGNEHNVNPLIYARAGYEPKDFVPVVRAISGPAVIFAATNQPFKTLSGLVEFARANPGKLSYGSSGVGGANHVVTEMFLKSAQIDVTHVPYKGGGPAVTDAAAGHIALVVTSYSSAEAFVIAGKLIPLAVTGPSRWKSLPDIPTVAESGFPEATYSYWMGIFAPTGTPLAVREKLNEEFRAVLDEAPVRDRLLQQGFLTAGGSVSDFESFLREDERISRRLMQHLRLKVE